MSNTEKNVVIDFSNLHTFCGFGNIADNYLPQLLRLPHPGINYILIVPDDCVKASEPGVDYIRMHHIRTDLKRLDRHVDLWHVTNQFCYFPSFAKDTIKLFTVHDLNFLQEKHGLHKLKHIVRLRYRSAHSDFVTTISKFVADELKAHVSVKCPMKVMYNGIGDMSGVEERQPAFIQNPDEKFFFALGQIREKKNFQKLVPMMRLMPDYKLYISGDDHFAYARELERIIIEEGCGHVILTGKITNQEKKWLYNHCQAFFFPSRLEGFGIPGLEAMQLGKQVFASTLSSLPEVLGDHAHYFSDFTPEAMAATVNYGLAHPKDSESMKVYAQQFSYQHYTENYVGLYKELLNL